MRKQISYFARALAVTITISSTMVWANSTDELSFEDTVRELNSQLKTRTPVSRTQGGSLADTTIHAGFAFINSVNTVNVGNGDKTRFDDGIQLSVGADLTSSQWVGEAVLRNFGKSRVAGEEMSLREFDIRLHFLERVNRHFGFRVINGLGARYMRWNDSFEKISENSSTPHYVLGVAFDLYATKNFSVGVEFAGRTSLIGETIDRGSLDLNIKLDSYL